MYKVCCNISANKSNLGRILHINGSSDEFEYERHTSITSRVMAL